MFSSHPFEGWYLTLAMNATRVRMIEVIKDFGKRLGKGNVGLFFFAGHGMQLDGTNYLIPVGAGIRHENDVRRLAVRADLVLEEMENAENLLNILILDACRDNPFARSYFTGYGGLAEMSAPTGSLICYATAPGSIASDGTGRNGVFTQYLLKHMKTPDLELSQMMKLVRSDVKMETHDAQIPWESSSLIGNFYFSRTRVGHGHGFLEPPEELGDRGEINDPGSVYFHKAISMQSDRPKKAIENLLRALEINPNNAAAYHLMGSIYLKDLNQYHKAVPLLLKATKLAPDEIPFLNDLGRAYIYTGEKSKAVRFLEASLELGRERAETHYLLGVAYQLLGSRSQAMEFLNQAVSLDPAYREKVADCIKQMEIE